MEEKTKVIIFIVICIMVGVGFWWYRNQKSINYCKDKCYYYPPREPVGLLKDKGDYWRFDDREFEDQKQCVDYCLRTK